MKLKNNDFSKCDTFEEVSTKSAKKRKKYGHMKDVTKNVMLSSHEIGEDFECKSFKCFGTVSENERNHIIREFNIMEKYNESHTTKSTTICYGEFSMKILIFSFNSVRKTYAVCAIYSDLLRCSI